MRSDLARPFFTFTPDMSFLGGEALPAGRRCAMAGSEGSREGAEERRAKRKRWTWDGAFPSSSSLQPTARRSAATTSRHSRAAYRTLSHPYPQRGRRQRPEGRRGARARARFRTLPRRSGKRITFAAVPLVISFFLAFLARGAPAVVPAASLDRGGLPTAISCARVGEV